MRKLDADWWRGGVIYQIYPRSFCDANNDGIGDLKGIASKLDYVASLGVDAIWISPFFKSPMKDFGYDVSDYCDIAPEFGTLADFDALIAKADSLGIRVMIDLVLSHSSDQHPWFIESRSSRDNPKADWYIWADPKPDGTPPNNWMSIFGGSAWEWDAKRRQYYMHNFLTSQPDLNFHNPDVQRAALETVEFWLKRGVKGFRLDTVNFFFHDRQLRDNPVNDGPLLEYVPESNPYNFQKHIYNKTQPENVVFLEKVRALLDQYEDCASVGEMSAANSALLIPTYTERNKRLHMVYTFAFLTDNFGPSFVREKMEFTEANMGSGWICLAFSNHDVRRVYTRWADQTVSADRFITFLISLFTSLRGSFCLYEGEELGLSEADIPFEKLQDPYGIRFWPEFKGRDGCRTPMPWLKDAPNAGFSSAEPWLPVPPEHAARAVEVMERDVDSCLHNVRNILHWRRGLPVLLKGDIRFLPSHDPILLFVREYEGRRVLAAFNFGNAPQTVDLSAYGVLSPLAGQIFTNRLDGGHVLMEPYSSYFADMQGT
jgi:alpha-glucosidase